jgi:hypothetical protein
MMGLMSGGIEAVLDHLKRTRAFDFTGYRRATLTRRIDKRMRQVGIDDYERYLEYLEVHPQEFSALLDTILINVSAFFRDQDAWDALRQRLVDELLPARPHGPIRVWSAGCASGREAYSVVMLLAEIMEPSDLVVRFEFERGGYTLPESARFMNRGLEFCLDVFDLDPWPATRVLTEAFCPPRRTRALGPDSYQDTLIGRERTPCFRIRKSHLRGPVSRHDSECFVGIVTAGSGSLTVGGETHALRPFDKIFVPAALGPWQLNPSPTLDLLECLPPSA